MFNTVLIGGINTRYSNMIEILKVIELSNFVCKGRNLDS
jgi:hypothetical protein